MPSSTLRSRALDTGKPLQIYRKEEVEDVDIQPARGIQYVFTGMEKAEEEEKHLQEILTAQVLGLQKHHEDLFIPCPEYHEDQDYNKLYRGNWRKPSQYVHAQPFFYEDYPAYDMDEEDHRFLKEEIADRWKLELSGRMFEEMISQLELNSETSTISLGEAKLLLKGEDDIILLVYEYWLKKRLRLKHSLVSIFRGEKVGCTADKRNPYVAFRRRFEKMQTRRNRKSDENSYTVMLKLRRDLHRAVTLLGFVRTREQIKKSRLEVELEVLEGRVKAKDWSGDLFNEVQEEAAAASSIDSRRVSCVSEWDDDVSVVDSDYESDEGPFAFRRKEGVEYLAPLEEEAWQTRVENLSLDGHQNKFLWTNVPGVCVGYCRRRVGRGGRVVIDRRHPVHSLKGEEMNLEVPEFGVVQPDLGARQVLQEWDPYRQEEESRRVEVPMAVDEPASSLTSKSPWRKRPLSGGMKTINVNKAGAHNAASAVINSQFIDLFSLPKSG